MFKQDIAVFSNKAMMVNRIYDINKNIVNEAGPDTGVFTN